MANAGHKNKKRKQQQQQVDTAIIIGGAVAVVLFVIGICMLVHILGVDGNAYVNQIINE